MSRRTDRLMGKFGKQSKADLEKSIRFVLIMAAGVLLLTLFVLTGVLHK